MAGKYKAYPEYINSEHSWLGDIPKDWKLIPIKHLSQFSGGGTPSKDNPEYWNGDIPWVSPKDMKTSRIVSTIDNVTEKAVRNSSTNLLNKGALLLVVRSGILQHSIPVAINDVPVTLNQDMKAIRFNRKFNAKYAMYLIAGSQTALLLEWRKQGATVESIDQEYLANTMFPVPGLNEQDKIIKFLDYETAKIDALIEKQKQFIQLLKEKRQAIISHTITKGLNPNAQMRDSGVEWLGDVPKHWDIRSIAHASSKITNGYVGPTRDILVDEGVSYVQATHIKNGRVNFDGAYFVRQNWSDAHSKSILREGDVLIVQTGAGTGDIGLVSKMEEGFNCHALIIVQPVIDVISGDYLSMVLQSHYGYSTLYSIRTGGMHPHLNCGEVQYIKLPVPPKEEQKKITSYISEQLRKFDLLVNKQLNAISLMQERRTALISAVVTGKIDVRDWADPRASLTYKEVAA